MTHTNRWIVLGCLVLALGACTQEQPASTVPSAAKTPDAATAAANTSAPEPTSAPSDTANPLCALATMAEVQALIGGTSTTVEVIDEPGLPTVTCVYVDARDLTASMTIGFVQTARLVQEQSQWPTAAAYFAEWTRNETPVSGLGEGAAWVDTTDSLDVLAGDTVLLLSSSARDTAEPAVRAQFEELARLLVTRLP